MHMNDFWWYFGLIILIYALLSKSFLLWLAQRSWKVIMFLPCPSGIRPSGGGGVKHGLKHVLGGFEYVLGVFGDSDFCPSVYPSSRPSGQWMGYVLCRELVLGFWGSEPETNLKWLNIYWSCAPSILDVRLDRRRSVWEGSELRLFNM